MQVKCNGKCDSTHCSGYNYHKISFMCYSGHCGTINKIVECVTVHSHVPFTGAEWETRND